MLVLESLNAPVNLQGAPDVRRERLEESQIPGVEEAFGACRVGASLQNRSDDASGESCSSVSCYRTGRPSRCKYSDRNISARETNISSVAPAPGSSARASGLVANRSTLWKYSLSRR